MDARTMQRELSELEPKLERLRALYEQYFMGFERIPPAVLRKEVDRTLWQLRKHRINNTRVRFKLNQMVQRYNTYQQYWQRTLRAIERGTYRRDIIRAARRVGREEASLVAGHQAKNLLRGVDEGLMPSGETGDTDPRSERAPDSSYPRSRRSQIPRSRHPSSQNLANPEASNSRARSLYDEYVRARRASGQPTNSLTYEKLKTRLAQQTDRLRRKHGSDKNVEFVVAMKDGKPVLRPVIK